MKEKWVVAAKRADFAAISKKFNIDPVTARLIRNRDVVGDDAIETYLHGGLEDMHVPWLMKDMEKAVNILQAKIAEKKKIRIIGDYDIDGICSTYILKQGLERLEAFADYDIPDRIRDGYGINRSLIDRAHDAGVDTILTCDNGIAAAQEIAYAKSLGMDVVVTDHHEVPFTEEGGKICYQLPPADAIINPKQADCAYPCKGLCGAVVAYKLMQALFERFGQDGDAILPFLKFAAIATIGDVMDLTGENRIIVRLGLEQIHHTTHPGLHALCEVNHLRVSEVNAYHIGFVIGPCLNASGRLDSAKRALQLLCAANRGEAIELAEDLKALNDSRKELTERGIREADEIIQTQGLLQDKVLVVYLENCHESIAGIIAGRIREAYGKPVFVLTKGEQSLKGSGRSIPSYSMFEKLQKCRDLLLHFGGHPMAAGLSLEEKNLPMLRKRLNADCGLTEEDFAEKIVIDVPMPISYITEKLVSEFSILEPFGKGNTKPVFAEKNLHVSYPQLIGKNKNVLKMSVTDGTGRTLPALCFQNAAEAYAYVNSHPVIAAVYYPQINEFRGEKSLQIVITHYF